MPVSVVQTVHQGTVPGTSSNIVVSCTSTGAGNCLFLVVTYPVTSSITSVVDNAGNTWTLVSTVTGNQKCSLYRCFSNVGGATTVTTTFNTTTSSTAILREYAGIVTALDKNVSSTGTGSSLTTGSTPTTSTPIELILGWGSISSPGSFIVGSGYANLGQFAGPVYSTFIEDLHAVTTAPYAANASITGGFSYGYTIACSTFIVSSAYFYLLGVGFQQPWNTTNITLILDDGSVGDTGTGLSHSGGSNYITAYYDGSTIQQFIGFQFTLLAPNIIVIPWILEGSNDTTSWVNIADGILVGTGSAQTVSYSSFNSQFQYYRLSIDGSATSGTITLSDWRIELSNLAVNDAVLSGAYLGGGVASLSWTP